MDEQSREDGVLALAAQKGLLTGAEIQWAGLPARASIDVAGGNRTANEYGPRLEFLIRSGRLSAAAVRNLLAELVAQQDTQDGGNKRASNAASAAVAVVAYQEPMARGPANTAIAPHLAAWPRYAIDSCLGQGGMAVVYKARDRKLGRTVALKFMRSADSHRAARFLREARAQARLDHPAICQIFEAGEYAGTPYIAMEYLPGEQLHRVQSPMSLEEKAFVVREVALALQAAHNLGILHRDIKPHDVAVGIARR